MAGLLSWVGNEAQKLKNTVQNDIVKPVQRDVIQPVSNAVQNVARPAIAAPRPVQQQPAVRSPFQVQPVRQPSFNTFTPSFPKLASTTVAQPKTLKMGNQSFLPSPTMRTQTANRTAFLNKQLRPNLEQQVKTGLQQKLVAPVAAAQQAQETAQQWLSRPLAELNATRTGKTFTPSNPIEHAAFGYTPVKPIQADVKGVHSTFSHSKNPVVRALATPAAVADIGLHIAQDAPAVGGIVKGASEGAKLALPAIKEAAPVIKEATSLVPRTTHNDQLTLQDLSNHYSGKSPLKPAALSATLSKARAIGQKHGVDITSGSQLDRMNAVNSILDKVKSENRAVSEGGYAKVPGSNPRKTPTGKPALQVGNNKVSSENSLPLEPEAQKIVKSFNNDAIPAPQRRSQFNGIALSTPDRQIGRALGMSDEQIRLAKARQNSATFSVPERMTPEPNVSSSIKRQLTHPPTSSSENTSANPLKVDIGQVAAGDYQKARLNGQLASNPIKVAGQLAGTAAKRAGLTTSQLGKMVEGTLQPKTPEEINAITQVKALFNRAHATSQALEGDTPFRQNYFRHEFDVSDPAKLEQLNKMAAQRGGNYDPYSFGGIDRQPRVFNTLQEAESHGFVPSEQNPEKFLNDYAGRVGGALRGQALAKGFTEADMGEADKLHTVDFGRDKSIKLSQKGFDAARPYIGKASKSTLEKLYDAPNRGLKKILLSFTEFHPINVNILKAAPTVALRGHPLLAAKGVLDTFAAQISKGYSDRLQTTALNDGTIEAAARIGTPIKFGSDFSDTGKLGKAATSSERLIFEQGMPAMHMQIVRSAVSDLQKAGVSLDSPMARQLGTRVNEIMGFMNQEGRNLDPTFQKYIQKIFLAPQFTRSKFSTLKSATTEGGLAGSYARRAVLGNTAMVTAVGAAGAYMMHQKSDNLNDTILRAIFHPSIATPTKDAKGNTQEIGLPATYTSEILGLLGFKLNRGTDGHLHVSISPGNVGGNLANYGRSRLAVLPSTGLKLATNTDYSNKPLYDPNASLGAKTEQAATTVGSGFLPIGAQGIVQAGVIKNHLPAPVQQVLNANSGGKSLSAKAVASAFGGTLKTDQTVGKGQQTAQYYAALATASKGLNHQEKDALDLYTGGKKNPVTGQYEIKPSANDARAKATALLQNPKTITNLATMNRNLNKEGQKVDPLWLQSKTNISKYLQYQAMPPGSADKTDWTNKNGSWYTPLATARNNFFNSLPPGDPNKPKAPIPYPTASPQVTNLQNQYDAITNSAQKGAFLDAHQELIDQWNKQANYTNAMRTSLGYSALKNSPQASTTLQKFMDTYNAADKTTRKSIRNSNPQTYQNMIAYYDSVDLNNINKQGAINQLQGEPNQTSKQNKAIQSLAQDIYQNPDGTYSIVPAGWMNGLSNGSGFGYSSVSGKPINATLARLRLNNAIPAPKAPKIASTKAFKAYKAPNIKSFSTKKLTIARGKTGVRKGIV